MRHLHRLPVRVSILLLGWSLSSFAQPAPPQAQPEQAGELPKRLVGWTKVILAPGARKSLTISIDSGALSIYDSAAKAWKLIPGTYVFRVGGSSQTLPLSAPLALEQ